MKRKWVFSIVSTLAAWGLVAHGLRAQTNPRGEASLTLGSTQISVDYGRPSLKGRDVMSLIKPGSRWRMGADAATTLSTSADLEFGSTRVPKGKYILIAHFLEPGKWNLILSRKSVYEYEPAAKVAEVPGTLEVAKESVEQVTIGLEGKQNRGNLQVAWGTYRLSVPFSAAH